MSHSLEALKKLYDTGRTSGQQTMSCGTVSASVSGRPALVSILSVLGKNVGSYYISDIESLMNSARMMGDTPTTNPNLIVLKVIMQEMIDAEKGKKSAANTLKIWAR